jgi:hypothetical protein
LTKSKNYHATLIFHEKVLRAPGSHDISLYVHSLSYKEKTRREKKVKVLQLLHWVTQRCCRVKNLENQESRCYFGVVRIREEKDSRGERLLRNWIKFSEVFEKS